MWTAMMTQCLLIITCTLCMASHIRAETDCSGEVKTLSSRMAKLEAVLETRVKRADDTSPLQAVVEKQAQELLALKAQHTQEISALRTQLQAAESKLAQDGSTYIRWGRSVCPNASELVYSGVAGGSKYSETGGASNRLCLSRVPQFDNAVIYGGDFTNIQGAEYYIPGNVYTDVPCAACRAPHPTTLMIPGTKTCPPGWTPQYSGHITAQHYTYQSNSEFLCLDGNPEDREGTGQHSNDGAFFMYSTASCGSLPCPPYVNGKVVTCVVCSK